MLKNQANIDKQISNLVNQISKNEIQHIRIQACGGPMLPACNGGGGGPRLQMIAYDDMA
ncbi:hypothetical protein MMO38_00595 [Acinetobacter sp. NIPH 1852]|uniref:hypothetical protein n=1 Tax=Acinetobacter sp. NIPH 1852 TaxID=2923428 RepID=UPI001F4A3B05|nr:hypothetical protein [Acinetobacter sp. NIPH 1852]MCH7306646.1 hypothetical protein [Acinetobacter sp. NIPH 1852]